MPGSAPFGDIGVDSGSMRNCHRPDKSTPTGAVAVLATSWGLAAHAASIRQAIKIRAQPLNFFVEFMSTRWAVLR
jgi:hypothetical protein